MTILLSLILRLAYKRWRVTNAQYSSNALDFNALDLIP